MLKQYRSFSKIHGGIMFHVRYSTNSFIFLPLGWGGLASTINRENPPPGPGANYANRIFLREPLKWPGEILQGHQT